ncbi:bifunctional molybdenum cofactor biosynthesis protein MoaC/MoaB [Rhizosphaericola mali]|uniref:Bifunctional molybdenum cofactor biosynthesis protein MoaC/MoaB n=1 Tax=Rhizosphaericola mali TaxID=2545455 RepID=A0A5P2FXX7_9BACT|nr:bifunctional molybdenum cofactor biosynthesis protein MoaC/MoaB [Rhizosphaericola mali]QES88394.1 bifunctional molybdenum cofactor biosynthesis protein MoaC/MoaB [Rhizosphaericola mali]
MVDITHKIYTLRKAIASAEVNVSSIETINKIKNNEVPKGNIFEFARAAGLLGIKKTSDLIPDCHPLPIEYTSINYEIIDLTIKIILEVHTIYRTGVEVEAMHGASIVALTMYDMLKPIDKGITINNIKLEHKSGGKSDYKKVKIADLNVAIIVCSDSISQNQSEDTAGLYIMKKMKEFGIQTIDYSIIPDNSNGISQKAQQLCNDYFDLLIFSGGTGLSDRDNTPDAILPLLTKQVDGPMEIARNYGQERMPYSMLSRGVAGFIDQTFVLTIPGSKNAAEDYMNALFPYLFHVFQVANGFKHS